MKKCEICGEEFPTKGPKKYCLACSKIVYKQQQDTWRAEHNIMSSKGMSDTMKCERCGKEIKRKNTKQKYCIKCGNIVNRENTRDRARAKKELILSSRQIKKEG